MAASKITVKEFLRINGPADEKIAFCANKKYGSSTTKTSKQWNDLLIADRVIDDKNVQKNDSDGQESEE